jgi:hypothetical protein
MITARQRDYGLDEIAPVTGTPTAPVAGNPMDALFGDVATAAFAGAFLGCLATEFFCAFGIAPGIASALATALLSGPLLLTRANGPCAGAFFPALYGGSFAGMTPIIWLSDGATGHAAASAGTLSVALSIVCGLVFFAVAELDHRSPAAVGKGIGGRLGAIAVVASFVFVDLVRLLGADTSRFHTVVAGVFDVEARSAIREFVACLAGIFGTLFVLRQARAGDSVPLRIFVASAAALFGLIVLQFGNPDDARAMDAFYAGCFLGMSTPERLKGWLQPVSGALVLIAVLVPVRAFLHGFGGGLGFAAFIAVMLLIGFSRAMAWMTRAMPTGNRSFARTIANVMAALFLMFGLISAEPLAEMEMTAVATTAIEPTAEFARLVVDEPASSAADDPAPTSTSAINDAEDDAGPAPQPTTDVTASLAAGLSGGELPHSVMVDQEAIFRAYLQFRGRAAQEIRATTRPARAAAVKPIARAQPIGRQVAAPATGLQLLFGGAAVTPPQPPVRRRVLSERQQPPAPTRPPPAPRRDRPTAASASP